MEEYIKITIQYCTEAFDEVLGYDNDGKPVAAFVVPGHFKETYPTHHNIIYVHPEYVFRASALDYNILLYMRFGSIALWFFETYPTSLFKHTFICGRAIEKLIECITPPKPSTYDGKEKISIQIDRDDIIINGIKVHYDTSLFYDIIQRRHVEKAITLTSQTNTVLSAFDPYHIELNDCKNGYFFKVYSLSRRSLEN